MLKKFNEWNFLIKENENLNEIIKEEDNFQELILEAIQGNVTKETIPHLFSDDTIKFLYQFDPDHWAKAEHQRYQTLFKAMQDRQNYYNEYFADEFETQKKQMQEIFDKQRELLKIYLNENLKETIINHCAKKNTFEKINKEKLNDWWQNDSVNGGKKYTVEDYPLVISKGKGGNFTYRVNLYLKEMVNRIEKGTSLSGADLSFPHEVLRRNAKNEEDKVKRFAGMILPTEASIAENIKEWKHSIANNMLSKELPKHDSVIEINQILDEEKPLKAKIRYKDMGENDEILKVEETILRKELSNIFQEGSWLKKLKDEKDKILRIKDKSEQENLLRDFKEKEKIELNNFILSLKDIFPFVQKYFDSISSSLKISGKLSDPETFLKDIVKITKDDEKKLDKIIGFINPELKKTKKKSEVEGEKKPKFYYKNVIDKMNEEGLIGISRNTSLMISFSNLLITKQIIDWAKNNNLRSINPIDNSEDMAKIDAEGKLNLPKSYMPTFKHSVNYEERGREVFKNIENMPLLMTGKVLKEKSRQELLDPDNEEKHSGKNMWNPYHGKYQYRYFDKSNEPYSGIQGSEDKLKGGLRPNQNIETFSMMCPSLDDDTSPTADNFWNRIKKIIVNNGKLSEAKVENLRSDILQQIREIKKEPDSEIRKYRYQEILPQLKLKSPSMDGRNVVISDIAKTIWEYLDLNQIENQKSKFEENIVAASNFMQIYNLVFSKIVSNLGDESLQDPKLLRKFVQSKVQIFMQKEIIKGKGAVATRKEKPEEEISSGETKEKITDITSIFERKEATQNIEKYKKALEEHALHLCREDQSVIACGRCVDPINGNCEIYMDSQEFHNDKEEMLFLFKEYRRTTTFSKISKPAIPTYPEIKPADITKPKEEAPPATPQLSTTPIPAVSPTVAVTKIEKEAEPEKIKIEPSLPQEKEKLIEIEHGISKILLQRIYSNFEKQRLNIAQERWEKFKKAYENKDLSQEELDKLMNQYDQEYSDLIQKVNQDYESLKLKMNQIKNAHKDFEDFVKFILTTYNLNDIKNDLQKEKLI